MMRSEEGAEIQTRHDRSPIDEWMRALLDAFDDPQVAIGALAENLERFLVRRAVMGSRRLLDTIELDDHDTLDHPGLISLGRRPARQKAPSGRLDRRTGELGITGQRLGARNRTIG